MTIVSGGLALLSARRRGLTQYSRREHQSEDKEQHPAEEGE